MKIKRTSCTLVIDLYSIFVNNKGQLKNDLTYDGLHLNEKGYEVVVKIYQTYNRFVINYINVLVITINLNNLYYLVKLKIK